MRIVDRFFEGLLVVSLFLGIVLGSAYGIDRYMSHMSNDQILLAAYYMAMIVAGGMVLLVCLGVIRLVSGHPIYPPLVTFGIIVIFLPIMITTLGILSILMGFIFESLHASAI